MRGIRRSAGGGGGYAAGAVAVATGSGCGRRGCRCVVGGSDSGRGWSGICSSGGRPELRWGLGLERRQYSARVDGVAGGGGSDRSRRRGGSGATGGADGGGSNRGRGRGGAGGGTGRGSHNGVNRSEVGGGTGRQEGCNGIGRCNKISHENERGKRAAIWGAGLNASVPAKHQHAAVPVGEPGEPGQTGMAGWNAPSLQ